MNIRITTIRTQSAFKTDVNCYLLHLDKGFILIDTGHRHCRKRIEQMLMAAGVRPGNLHLILLTHGDFDHSGNAAYFSKLFCAEVAMHVDDTLMVERGDRFWNRHRPNFLIRSMLEPARRLPKVDRFRPDFYVKDGQNLCRYGFAASIVHLPGHSRGSIGILTADGDLFCGNLLVNTDTPSLWPTMDDPAAAQASLKKLKRLDVKTVYPGHGRPFSMRQSSQQHHNRQHKVRVEASV